MVDFSAAFHLQKMNSGNPVVYALKEQFGSVEGSPYKADACDRIAGSLRQLGQVGEAAKWYEAAGLLVYGRSEFRPELRALFAVEEFERALECHIQEGDAEASCYDVVRALRKVCAPA